MMVDHELRELVQFWGKARSSEETGPAMHPLMAHMLDVAAVAMELPLGRSCGLDLRLVGFLVALHDIGKLSPKFQRKASRVCPGFLLEKKTTASRDHTVVSLQIINKWFKDEKSVVGELLEPLLQKVPSEDKQDVLNSFCQLLRGVAGHHGRPVQDINDGKLDTDTLCYAKHLVMLFLDVFQPSPFPVEILEHLRELEWRLAALTIQADWVGSRQEWFPYAAAEELYDPKSYFQKIALPRARRAVEKAGLDAISVSEFNGIKNLFPYIETASPLQAFLETAPLPEGPVLVIIEDMTGSGKTEAALTVAHRLMESVAASHETAGLFVGLPTMATANAMYERLAKAYRKLFDTHVSPSLALAHGRADLDERFQAAIAPEDKYGVEDHGDPESAESYCTSWLGNESRRALMAHVGVGTIDQALLSVLPVRHTTIRQAGLAHKVLLIDECHAFDAYMNEEIFALLRFHAASGGSAILLSATLTKDIRTNLVKAFRSGCGVKPNSGEKSSLSLQSEAYPLVTIAGSSTPPLELPCALRAGLARNIKVIRLNTLQSAEEILRFASQKGAACCWIRNTVDDVIQSARDLSAQGEKVTVFHARFAMIDRLEIEKTIIARFGKKSKAPERAGLLIASQVIEQSLDLDFDVLCTDLAPMDLILQRAGRLRRHQRDNRPIDKAELFVLSPEPVTEPDQNWIKAFLPGTAEVYCDPALLWRTARALFRRGTLSLPDDTRSLIEEAGDNRTPGTVPPALKTAANDKEEDDKAGGRQARHNVLHFNNGYDRDQAPWGPEEQTPTRLETGRYVTVRLAFEQNGNILPWAVKKGEAFESTRDKRKSWALSEVSVRQNRLATAIVPEALSNAAQEARSGWSQWECEDVENYLLLVLMPHDDKWSAEGFDKENRKVTLYYGERYGLEIQRE